MQQKPQFSVIIPTLNEERALPLLLHDIYSQRFQSLEVIIVDAHSKDKTKEKVLKIAQTHPYVHLYSAIKKGPAAQRNQGAKKAKGTYLLFFDADARLPKDFFKVLSQEIEKNPSFLYTTYLASYDHARQDTVLLETTNVLLEVVNTVGRPFASGTSIIIDRHVFLRLGGFDTTLKLAEDHELVQRVRKAGVLMRILQRPVIYFSMRRPKQIGYLKFLTQYTVSGMQTFFGKQDQVVPFEYPMGGDLYNGKKKDDLNITDIEQIKKFAHKAARSVGIEKSK